LALHADRLELLLELGCFERGSEVALHAFEDEGFDLGAAIALTGQQIGLGPVGQIMIGCVDDVEFVDDEAMLTDFGTGAIGTTGDHVAIKGAIARIQVIRWNNANLAWNVVRHKGHIQPPLLEADRTEPTKYRSRSDSVQTGEQHPAEVDLGQLNLASDPDAYTRNKRDKAGALRASDLQNRRS
jgi:hypothetical protein